MMDTPTTPGSRFQTGSLFIQPSINGNPRPIRLASNKPAAPRAATNNRLIPRSSKTTGKDSTVEPEDVAAERVRANGRMANIAGTSNPTRIR
jgi:hypothetical protein